MSKNIERNYGIDLLRIVLMFMICVHHVIGQGGVLNSSTGVNLSIYKFLYIITCCAVDGYAIISGYVVSNVKHRYEKIVTMWFQVFFYSFGMAIAVNVLRFLLSSTETFNISEVISNMFPLFNGKYWYFNAYFVLFFFMPIISPAIFDMDEKKSKGIFYILLILVVIMFVNEDKPSLNFLSNGRSAFWLVILYVLGMLIKKLNLFSNLKTKTLVIILLALNVLSWISTFLIGDILIINDSPIMLLISIVLVVLFSRFKPNVKIVSFVSPLTFGVYLFHEHFLFRYYYLSERLTYISDVNVFKGLFIIVYTSIFIFVLGLLCDYIRTQIFKLFKISALSKKITNKINGLI